MIWNDNRTSIRHGRCWPRPARRFVSPSDTVVYIYLVWAAGRNTSATDSLHFSGHFPDGSGFADTRTSPFWISLELRMTEVVSGDIWSCKTSNHHYQPTSLFTGRMPFLSPNQQCQRTELTMTMIRLIAALQFHTGWVKNRTVRSPGCANTHKKENCSYVDHRVHFILK